MKCETASMMAFTAAAAAAEPNLVPRQTGSPEVSISIEPGATPSPGRLTPDFGSDGPSGECISNAIELLFDIPKPADELVEWYSSVAAENVQSGISTLISSAILPASTPVTRTGTLTTADLTTPAARLVKPRQFGDILPSDVAGVLPTDVCQPQIADMEEDVASAYTSYQSELSSWLSDHDDDLSTVMTACPSEVVSGMKQVSECTVTPTVLASSGGGDDEDDDDDDDEDDKDDDSDSTDEGGAPGVNSFLAASLAGIAAFGAAVTLL